MRSTRASKGSVSSKSNCTAATNTSPACHGGVAASSRLCAGSRHPAERVNYPPTDPLIGPHLRSTSTFSAVHHQGESREAPCRHPCHHRPVGHCPRGRSGGRGSCRRGQPDCHTCRHEEGRRHLVGLEDPRARRPSTRTGSSPTTTPPSPRSPPTEVATSTTAPRAWSSTTSTPTRPTTSRSTPSTTPPMASRSSRHRGRRLQPHRVPRRRREHAHDQREQVCRSRRQAGGPLRVADRRRRSSPRGW